MGSQAKGVADAGSAAFRVSGLEVGGLFGSLLAGRISDALIAKDPKGGNVGKRVQVNPARCVELHVYITCQYSVLQQLALLRLERCHKRFILGMH